MGITQISVCVHVVPPGMRHEGCRMRQEIARAIALFILSVNSFTDVRRHEIDPFLTIAGGIAGIAFLCMEYGRDTPLPSSLLPGICFLLFSFISRGAVGAGDGFVLIALAGCLSVTEIFITAVCAMFLASVCAGIMLFCGFDGRKRFAFVPFLLGGFVLYLMI